jgi:hypothetical protein
VGKQAVPMEAARTVPEVEMEMVELALEAAIAALS